MQDTSKSVHAAARKTVLISIHDVRRESAILCLAHPPRCQSRQSRKLHLSLVFVASSTYNFQPDSRGQASRSYIAQMLGLWAKMMEQAIADSRDHLSIDKTTSSLGKLAARSRSETQSGRTQENLLTFDRKTRALSKQATGA